MENVQFYIDGTKLSAPLCPEISAIKPLEVNSVPRSYQINWNDQQSIVEVINNDDNAILLADKSIAENWLQGVKSDIPSFLVEATEVNKTIQTAIEFAEYLESVGTTKGDMVYVVGGGIMQDLGAFSCAMFKRGIPWTYIPTTLLGMADSCIGGKTGLNHGITKNLLALFSAPAKIIHDTSFLKTLPRRELVSGFGEALRLHVTGGLDFLEKFEREIDGALHNEEDNIQSIINSSLSVKKAVVENDEFEISLRRSMNYGHSMGHALEALTSFAFPHGMAISLGCMLENVLARDMFGLPADSVDRVNKCARKLVDRDAFKALKVMNTSDINSVLKKDKKTIGNTLKLAIPKTIGNMLFHDFPLNDTSESKIQNAIREVCHE